ncbi:MAG TPA: hypothetical protein VNM34_02280 [Verrucomicrobiae bacterium]|nr:hypothetical protein [Verrucomicrobiae bacterium]
MTVTRSTRRARRGFLLRRIGWLAAAAMLAVAAIAPTSVAAANPQPQDNACNNIGSGGRSPDFVWTTVGTDGVTAHWAIDANHFDAANFATVTVRVCVFDANGPDQGGIDQNTENDGVQLFAWSLLGYNADPCPSNDLTFGSSVDSPAVQTKKSNFIDCPAGEPSTAPSTEPSTAPSTEPSTQPSTEPSTAPSTEPSTAPSTEPSTQPSTEPSTAPSTEPSTEPSTPPSTEPSTEPSTAPSAAPSTQPTGGVEGVTGTPGVTPPPTDTLTSGTHAPASDGWRAILVLLAAVLVGTLVASQPRQARRRA